MDTALMKFKFKFLRLFSFGVYLRTKYTHLRPTRIEEL